MAKTGNDPNLAGLPDDKQELAHYGQIGIGAVAAAARYHHVPAPEQLQSGAETDEHWDHVVDHDE